MDPLELEADLPPAARYVAHVLQEADDPLDAQEIAQITAMPRGTLKGALRDLREADAVEVHPRLDDTRGWVYERSESG